MTELQEFDQPSTAFDYIRLPEVEAAGEGAVYQVLAGNLEPVAVYAGDGIFRGLYVEQHGSESKQLRVAWEQHHDERPGRTLWPLEYLESAGRLNPVDYPNLAISLVDLLVNFYKHATSAAQSDPAGYRRPPYELSLEELQAKLQLFADVQNRLASGELIIPAGGRVML